MFLGVSDSPVMWAWASIRPGISVLPPTSMTAASRTSTGFGDTATMRPSFTRILNDGCISANPSRTRLALVKSVWGIRNLSRDNTTLLYVPGLYLAASCVGQAPEESCSDRWPYGALSPRITDHPGNGLTSQPRLPFHPNRAPSDHTADRRPGSEAAALTPSWPGCRIGHTDTPGPPPERRTSLRVNHSERSDPSMKHAPAKSAGKKVTEIEPFEKRRIDF